MADEVDEFLQQAEGLAFAFGAIVDEVAGPDATLQDRTELAAQAVARMFETRLGGAFAAAALLADVSKKLRRHAMQTGAGQ